MESEGSLPCAKEPATCPYPEPDKHIRSILILSSHYIYVFCVVSSLLFSDQNVCISYLTHPCYEYMLSPSHSPSFDHPNNIWWNNLRSSSLCILLRPPATSSLLYPNILPSTLFSNTLNNAPPLQQNFINLPEIQPSVWISTFLCNETWETYINDFSRNAWSEEMVKVKTKLSPCLTKYHVMNTYWGSGSIAPRILNLETQGGEWSASHLGRFTLRETAAGTHWLGGLVGPKPSQRAEAKRKPPTLPLPGIGPRSSSS
jgi:hypothetical protein